MLMDLLRDKMKLIIYIVIIAFVGGGTLVYLNSGGNAGVNQNEVNAQDNEAIATVNGSEISNSDFQSQVNQTLSQSQGEVSDSQVLSLKKRVLDQLVDRKLIEEELEERGLVKEISEEKVDQRLDKIVEDSQFETKDELADRLKQAGRSIDDIREQLKQSLAMQKLFDNVLKDIEVTDEEVAGQYEEISASHILIKNEDKNDKKAKEKAEKALEELNSGKDFATVAEEYSEGPSAERGGELGSFSQGKMVPGFEDVAFDLDKGEISDPVKTKFGYHVIKVTDKKEATGEEFEKEKGKIKEELLNNKKKEAFNSWIADKKDKADVTINSKEILGYQAQEDEDYDTAVTNYKAALEENGKASYLYYNLATAYQKQDKEEKAIEIYEEGIDKYPEQTEFYDSLASLYQDKGQVDKAISIYENALEKNEDNANLHLALGELYRNEEMEDKALEQYDKFSKLAGDDLMAHYRLYSVYQKMGLKEKAEKAMKRVKELQAKQQQQQQQQQQQLQQQKQQPQQQQPSN
ncbi:MAG: peptidylprolyl isomerase [Bacillota bacterium]